MRQTCYLCTWTDGQCVCKQSLVDGNVNITASSSSAPSRSFIRTCQKAKRVRFFRNGDQYFKGVWYAITPEKFRSFDALLADLTRTLDDLVSLPSGVRQVFTLDGLQKISSLQELLDGQSYVCSSNDSYKRIDYVNAKEPIWSFCTTPKHNRSDEVVTADEFATSAEKNDFVHPKIITVIRNGVKPRKVVRMLLNRRTAHLFDQVVRDITDAVKLDSGVVKRIFTLQGEQVTTLAHFFGPADVFIAYGTERLCLDDFDLDAEEHKFLFSPRFRPSNLIDNWPMRSGRDRSKLSSSSSLPRLYADASNRAVSGMYGSPIIRRKYLKQKNPKKLRPRPGYNFVSGVSSNTTSTPNSESCEPLDAVVEEDAHSELIEQMFCIGRLIGDGNFAKVYASVDRRSEANVALKVIDKSKCSGKEEMVENEVRLMRRIRHHHIVQLFDELNTPKRYYLSMELVVGGDLFDSLVSVRQFTEPEAAVLHYCLMSALEYLHDHQIVHRDVKPENLLMYEDVGTGRKQLKLADFGLASECFEPLYTVCGTPTYVAPEILSEIGYGTKVDVWAAGVILYIMLCGFPPFVSLSNNQEELFDQILTGEYTFTLPYWEHVSCAAKSLIEGMLQLDADNRVSAAEVLAHPWITSESRCAGGYDERLCSPVIFEFGGVRSGSQSSNVAQQSEYFYARRRSMDELSQSTAVYSLSSPKRELSQLDGLPNAIETAVDLSENGVHKDANNLVANLDSVTDPNDL